MKFIPYFLFAAYEPSGNRKDNTASPSQATATPAAVAHMQARATAPESATSNNQSDVTATAPTGQTASANASADGIKSNSARGLAASNNES